ncbi:MAG: MGH1-like glycoside hydrolase domain-containing protein [Pseudorhodobacter sp.]
MLKDKNIETGSWWNSWSSRPAELVFLPGGIHVTPVLYSSQLRKAIVPGPADMCFGAHGVSGDGISYETIHGGTRMAFYYDKPDPFRVTGHWRVTERKEWGLRYWVVLCLWAEDGGEIRYCPETGAARSTSGDRIVTLQPGSVPVLVTGHDNLEDLIADFDANGYFHLENRATSGKLVALRFNLEMMPELRFSAAVADSPELSLQQARLGLQEQHAVRLALHDGYNAGALDAVHDVIGWNTVYDQVNRRRYTAISRIWNLGEFAVWFNDQTFAAMMSGLFDATLAQDNLKVALGNATPQGNFACLLTSRDTWLDRSQAPHGAFMAWQIFQRGRDRGLLRLAYPALVRNHHWWRANRDPDGRGLVSCGSSDLGQGLYRGTAFGARNETGMDNSATHDEAVFDPQTGMLSTLDLGLNCALALDAEMLAAIARELGDTGQAAIFEKLAAETRARIRAELWDETRQIFANRQRGGGFVRSLGPTSFYPLLCGAASDEQAGHLLCHLADPDLFGGRFMLPNATRNDPAYGENTYWRGRIWPNVNYFVWQGLRRYGFDAEAADLAAKGLAMFNASWHEKRLCGENYNAETGEITDQGDADPFYTWGAMLPLLGVCEITEISPWRGWEITNHRQDLRLGPMLSPVGEIIIEVRDGTLTLHRADEALFSTDIDGALQHLVLEDGLCSFRPSQRGGKAVFRLGKEMTARLTQLRIDGCPVEPRIEEGCAIVDLAGLSAGIRVDFHLAPRS